jgi:hypothetical protein
MAMGVWGGMACSNKVEMTNGKLEKNVAAVKKGRLDYTQAKSRGH